MSKVGKIYVIGSIGSFWADVSLNNVIEQVKALGNVDEYVVEINSGGGEVMEGYAIHNYLLSLGKKVTTRGIGMVASIATVIFLAGSKRQLYPTTQFLIHNPWSGVEGDADTMERRASELREMESQLLDFYVAQTGSDIDTLRNLMTENKFIPADLANELKFATEIIEPVKAFAQIKLTNTKPNNTMSKIGKMFKDAFKALKEAGAILNESVMTTDGKELEIEMAGDTVAEGDTVTMSGEPASGMFELSDGTKITVEEGTITAVEKASAKQDDAEDDEEMLDKIKAELETLKSELATMKSENDTLKSENAEMSSEVAEIVAHLKTLKVNANVPQSTTRFAKQSGKKTPAAESTESFKEKAAAYAVKRKSKTRLAV